MLFPSSHALVPFLSAYAATNSYCIFQVKQTKDVTIELNSREHEFETYFYQTVKYSNPTQKVFQTEHDNNTFSYLQFNMVIWFDYILGFC